MLDWPSYTIKEAGEKTGYNEEYLRRLIRENKIESVKIGTVYFIRVESLEKYVAAMQNTQDGRTGPKKRRKK